MAISNYKLNEINLPGGNYLEKSALSGRRKVQAAGGHIKDSWAVGSGFRPLGHRHRHPLASISDLGIHYGDIYLGARH